LSKTPHPSWPDERLVKACLRGQSQAWDALVDKFKKLVFAIILDFGVPNDDAADVFQSVWFDACKSLSTLRKQESFKAWLTSLTLNRCRQWLRNRARSPMVDTDEIPEEEVLPEFVDELESQQLIREAIFELPDRCRELVNLLFFDIPPKPYAEVAEQLGLAIGSIGFIRGRCLKKLRKILVEKGLGDE